MTSQAETAARARLLAAMREPERRRTPRLGWRLAVAATLAVTAGAGVVVTRDQPHTVSVASVRELGERAAQAAFDDRAQVAGPGQWLYIKALVAPQVKSSGVDVSKRIVREQWSSVDGEHMAWLSPDGKLERVGNHPRLGADDLGQQPITTEGVMAKIRVALGNMRRLSQRDGPTPVADDEVFQAVYQIMATQALPPEVRAALFRGLATIPGVGVTEDIPDADGRRGVAFSYTDDFARYALILDPQDFRYLGAYGVTVEDQDMGSFTIKAGTPVVLTARLEARVVDGPGQK